MLGAQAIIMGSLQTIGSIQRIRFQAISTEDAVIQHVFSEDVSSDSVLASLLGDSVPPPAENSGGFFSALSVKFSAGLVFGVTRYWNDKYFYRNGYYLDHSETGSIINLINPTLNLRLLYPLKNKLQLGIGADITYSIVRVTIYNNDDDTWPATGTIAPYAIIGYGNEYLHVGYDFVYGGLYVCPNYGW